MSCSDLEVILLDQFDCDDLTAEDMIEMSEIYHKGEGIEYTQLCKEYQVYLKRKTRKKTKTPVVSTTDEDTSSELNFGTMRVDLRLEKQRIIKRSIRKKLKSGIKGEYSSTSFESVQNSLLREDKEDSGYLPVKRFTKCLGKLKHPLSRSEMEYLIAHLKTKSSDGKIVEYDQIVSLLGLGEDAAFDSEEDSAPMELGTNVLSTERNLRKIFSTKEAALVFQMKLKELDVEKTGKLKANGFQKAFQHSGFDLEAPEMKVILSKFPHDRQGRISCSDFLKRYNVTAQEKLIQFQNSADRLRKLFEKCDLKRNGTLSGRISSRDFQTVLKVAGLELKLEEIPSSIVSIGSDKKIDYPEIFQDKPSEKILNSKSSEKIVLKFFKSKGLKIIQESFETADRMKHGGKLRGILNQRDFMTVLRTIGMVFSNREEMDFRSGLFDQIDYNSYLEKYRKRINNNHFDIKGSIGEWLATRGSTEDRKNFELFINLLHNSGLETIDTTTTDDSTQHLCLKLGPTLNLALRFFTTK